MTRRERLENKLQKRLDWAAGRQQKSAAAFNAARAATAGIPFGQPILVGHHSEKRHRAAIDRAHNAMGRGVESAKMADHHESKAAGIESQLENSIFSDDANAIAALEARIAEREAERDQWKKWNAHYRKHKTMKGLPGLSDEAAAKFDADIAQGYSWEKQPVPSYRLSNLGATIRSDKKRIEDIKRRQARSQAAEDAGGTLVKISGDWASVTFAEKPDRAVINELKAAGFYWGGGSWSGYAAKLPAEFQPAPEAGTAEQAAAEFRADGLDYHAARIQGGE